MKFADNTLAAYVEFIYCTLFCCWKHSNISLAQDSNTNYYRQKTMSIDTEILIL